ERVADALEQEGVSVRRLPTKGRTRPRVWALDARVVGRAARVRALIPTAGSVYVAGQLHDVRIAVKKLRYAAELSEPSEPAETRRLAADLNALKGAQDLLGRLHDLEVLLTWGRDIQAALVPPDLNVWRELGALARTIENECSRLHARFMHECPRLTGIATRMGADRYTAPTDRQAIG